LAYGLEWPALAHKDEKMKQENYCAFLRGVNVNGRTMKMVDVCDAFRKAGMSEVASILASGNIAFSSDYPRAKLRSLLESTLTTRYGAPVYLFVKTADEVCGILAGSPFAENAKLHIYAFICEPMLETVLFDEFSKIVPAADEKACIQNGYFYWQCAKGATLTSGFSKILGRKTLREHFTSRNMGTIAKVQAKMT